MTDQLRFLHEHLMDPVPEALEHRRRLHVVARHPRREGECDQPPGAWHPVEDCGQVSVVGLELAIAVLLK